MTKKQLRAELEMAHKEIRVLQEDVARLERMKTYLINKLSDPIEKAERDLYLALCNNITKSLNQKIAVDMKPDEKDAVYYLLGRRVEIRQADDTKSLAAQAQSICSPCQNLQASWKLI